MTKRRPARTLILLVGVFAAGTLGYRVIEGAGWWDSFYMTTITLTTVGYREIFPLSRAGEVFTTILLVGGIGVILFVATEVARQAVEGELRQIFGHARRSRMIEKMSGHEIVCGWGRMGQAVAEELKREGRTFVVIECHPDKLRRLREEQIPCVEGDATAESVLRAAGADRARGLVSCLNDDAHNVYTVLTARSLNPDLFIVARAGESGAEARLARAGASKVVNPYHLGGIRLAQLLVKPAVVDFLDVSLDAESGDLHLEQFPLSGTTGLTGHTLASVDLRRAWGVAVVAIKRGPRLIPNPEPDLRLEEGDVLVVAGSRAQLEAFDNGLLGAREGPERR